MKKLLLLIITASLFTYSLSAINGLAIELSHNKFETLESYMIFHTFFDTNDDMNNFDDTRWNNFLNRISSN